MYSQPIEQMPHEVFPRRDHAVNMADFESLFAEGKNGSPQKDDEIDLSEFIPTNTRKPLPPEIAEHVQLEQTAEMLRTTAIQTGHAYEIATGSETRLTMVRALGVFGMDVAAKSGVDTETVKLAQIQLKNAPQFGSDAEKPYAVDPSAYLLTTWSLAQMHDKDKDEVNQIQADEALNKLRQGADLERLRREDILGPHTGELAVEAILEHHFVAPLV